MQGRYVRSDLVAYILSELSNGTDEADLAQNVAAYLIQVNKLQELDSVMRDVQEARAQKTGIVELTVRSAHQLGEAQLQEIESVAKQQYPAAKSIVMHQVHDSSVLGGASVRLPHASLDITIRAKLNQLREAVA